MTDSGSGELTCPSCGTANIAGVDFCENCRSDLRRIGLPGTMQPRGETDFSSLLTEIRLSQPRILPRTATVGQAVDLLRGDPNAAVVVRTGGRVEGIFTERDVLVKVAGSRPFRDLPLTEFMTPDPVVLRDTDTVAIALNKMVVGGFRHIPLVHGDELAGVVTASDLMQWFMQRYFD